MLILLSPAKTFSKLKMDFKTMPTFEHDASMLVEKLKKRSIKRLMQDMHLSESLAKTVHHDYQTYGLNRGAAIYLYDGQAFKGLDVISMDSKAIEQLNDKLMILSGLYGILRPLDGISTYRLEMKDASVKNLYAFWKPRVNTFLKNHYPHDLIINLASQEYGKLITHPYMISIDFRQVKEGVSKSISMLTKKARGMMARHLIDMGIEDLEAIKHVTCDGYTYQEALSSSQTLIFSKVI